MSRSKPNDNTPNPASRWYEWNGEHGKVRHYDKDAKQNVEADLPFTFVLLDELGSVRGWHESSSSGIYSNEVRDTRQDVLVVKAFKGGTLVEGLYKDIKDRANSAGGHFVANCYIAIKGDDGMDIGAIRFKGAALGAWMEFRKANRSQLYKKAVEIDGFTEGKKGRVVFRVPTFKLKDLSESTNQIALGLDAELQTYLTTYLNRTKRDQVETVGAANGHDDDVPHEPVGAPLNDDDIPF